MDPGGDGDVKSVEVALAVVVGVVGNVSVVAFCLVSIFSWLVGGGH